MVRHTVRHTPEGPGRFVNTLLACAMILAAVHGPTPSPRANQTSRRDTTVRAVTPVVHDTVRLILQQPPTVNVAAQSQVPAMVLGVAGLILLGLQLWIMARQTGAMNRQTELSEKQTALLDKESQRQRVEAAGTFYRIAHDLAEEFRKADVLPTTPVPANYETHPRQMLREASRLFAPLGNPVVRMVTEAAAFVEMYFTAVEDYNANIRTRDGAGRWGTMQQTREQVGRRLDMADHLIPAELRWKYDHGTDYNFARLCVMRGDLAKAIMGGPIGEGAGPEDPENGG
jgi:hypothetical protein